MLSIPDTILTLYITSPSLAQQNLLCAHHAFQILIFLRSYPALAALHFLSESKTHIFWPAY